MGDAVKLTPIHVPTLLRTYGLRPKKSLGQNFLMDDGALRRVADAAEITAEDEVLEVGPGLGSLTRHLALQARRVVAVELDRALLPVLEEVLGGYENVAVVSGDILEIRPETILTQQGYLVAANIPYYITSAIIRHLLEATLKPRRMVLTVQREVAERICARETMNLLALSVQVFGAARVVAQVPSGAFYPAPEVDSSVVRVDLSESPVIRAEERNLFFSLAKAGFSQKRKTLRNSLAGGLHLAADEVVARLNAAGIDPQRRAETLSLVEWGRLVESWPEK